MTSPKRKGYARITMSESESLSRVELLSLLEIAGELAGQIDGDRLVNTILDRACGKTHSPDGSGLLYDEERRGLFFAAACGAKGPELLDQWGEGSNLNFAGREAVRSRNSDGLTPATHEDSRFLYSSHDRRLLPHIMLDTTGGVTRSSGAGNIRMATKPESTPVEYYGFPIASTNASKIRRSAASPAAWSSGCHCTATTNRFPGISAASIVSSSGSRAETINPAPRLFTAW